MLEFVDVVDFYIAIINALKSGAISPQSPLDEIALKSGKDGFAYIDNRRDARGRYDYDLWRTTKNQFESEKEFVNGIKSRIKNEKLLYSKSEQFPDFMFKARKHAGRLVCGSLLELKDSKSGTIASFNSTLPTKYKSLEEINVINGGDLVARVASIIDDKLSSDKLYHTFERRCFYLVRTHANSEDKMKISVVDGSFFETVPKEHLIYQMFLNILHNHLEKKEIKMPPGALDQLEKTLSCVTDQTIIAASQIIEKASVRPRLRIMAEVYPEGNPHTSFYPEVSERSINFIVGEPASGKELAEEISQKILEIKKFTIQHKRNGKHVVFQFQF
ncbi:hypothetical protein DRN76_00630 [Methanosarcinales archaeon]|nr:MAG: hypothetical protein DRN76_00630 [Methanosarcinales archaeon]